MVASLQSLPSWSRAFPLLSEISLGLPLLTLVLTFRAHPDNPEYTLHFKTLNLLTSAKPSPYKLTLTSSRDREAVIQPIITPIVSLALRFQGSRLFIISLEKSLIPNNDEPSSVAVVLSQIEGLHFVMICTRISKTRI